MEKKQILLVDDESFVLDMMEWYLAADKEMYDIFRASSAEDAMEIIKREQIFLVVSDINMPGMSGLDLLSAIRSRYPHIKVILMTGDKSTEVRQEVQNSGCLHFLEKPLEMKELRQAISEEVSRKDEGFNGTLRNIRLDDLIQLCCHAAINTAIRVSKGEKNGMIFIRDGEIVHAVCENSAGENAFYEILGWRSGRFETLGEVFIPAVSISRGCHHLLMESARRTDEEGAVQNAKCKVQSDEDEEQEDKIRVLIADDSSMMCKVLTEIISSDQSMTVIGTAKNGEEALQKRDELMPDVIAMDVNMPVMDGITALKHIMIRKPCPVVVMSNVGEKSLLNVADFLRLGAADFLAKPVRSKDMDRQRREIISRIRQAACAKMDNYRRVKEPKILQEKEQMAEIPCKSMVIINSGPGGYVELLDLICSIKKATETCFVVFQTMPQEFVASFAEYLNQRCVPDVLPLGDNPAFSGGCCYISSNDFEENRFDAFLNSVADSFSGHKVVILLSGAVAGNMSGLRRIHEQGGKIVVQKLSSCMVSEPLEGVINAGLNDAEAATSEIAAVILRKTGSG